VRKLIVLSLKFALFSLFLPIQTTPAQWRQVEEKGGSVVQVVASYAGAVSSGRRLCVFFDESRGIDCDVSARVSNTYCMYVLALFLAGSALRAVVRSGSLQSSLLEVLCLPSLSLFAHVLTQYLTPCPQKILMDDCRGALRAAGAICTRQQEALSWLTAGQLAASIINFTPPNLLIGTAVTLTVVPKCLHDLLTLYLRALGRVGRPTQGCESSGGW
jgi:hypothetical protein